MNLNPGSLNPSVSAALSGWLALAADDRATLMRAIAALNDLGAGRETGPPASPLATAPKGDRALTIDDVGPFDSDLFRSRSYQALGAGQSITVYCAGSRGLFELAQRIGASHYKIGWTRGHCAETRLAHLRATAYGACWQDGPSLVRESGWNNWEGTVLPVRTRPAGSPVRCLGRALAVDLPEGVEAAAFDTALMRALAPRALSGMADSDVGRAQCRAQAIDPVCLRRLTEQPGRRGPRLKAARELFAFAPRREADALARLVEAVVARAVAPLLRG